MKKISVLSILTIFALMLFNACGGGGSTEQASTSTTEPESKTEEVSTAPAQGLEAQLALGEQIYTTKCITCHQADAKGLKGAFPPLAGSDYLLADPVRGVAQTLNGSHKEITVNGEVYNAPMVPQLTTKEDAVAVINYVLKHFNGYTDDQLLTMDDVKDVVIDPMPITQ
jgi:nitrite reductase (NO-forming)